jgi:hypothetical protein
MLHTPEEVDLYRVMAGSQQLEFGCVTQYPQPADAAISSAFARSFELK